MTRPESGGNGCDDGVGELGVGVTDVGRRELVSDAIKEAVNEGVSE